MSISIWETSTNQCIILKGLIRDYLKATWAEWSPQSFSLIEKIKRASNGVIKKLNIGMINKANEAEALPSPSNDKHQSDKNRTMFDIIDENSQWK